jgi:hypothetical protein
MAIVKHPKNRHVMAASAKSKTWVTRAVKPNRKAARAAGLTAAEAPVPAAAPDEAPYVEPERPD